MTEKCIPGIWKKCLKCFMNNFEVIDKDEHISVIHKTIMDLANMINLDIEDI